MRKASIFDVRTSGSCKPAAVVAVTLASVAENRVSPLVDDPAAWLRRAELFSIASCGIAFPAFKSTLIQLLAVSFSAFSPLQIAHRQTFKTL